MKSLTIRHDSAQVRDLNDMREFLEKAVLALGGSDDDAGDLVLAVNEAVTNVLLHGYDNRPGPVTICVEVVDNDLRVILTASAPLSDPPRVPPPDIFLPLEDRPLGGLGVHMMRQLTDELLYRPLADGNELVFVKRGVLARAKA